MMAQIQQQEKNKLDLAPKKFVMWLFIGASFLLFAALTSAFIVYSGGTGHGIHIKMPIAFAYSTTVIVMSSLTMYLASKAAKQLQFSKQRMFLWLTMALGIAFFIIQLYAWSVLVSMKVYFSNPNASQSFIYVFTGMHLLHIVAGLMFILNSLIGSYRNIPQVKNLFWMDMSSIFWHFVDIVWIYLYVFLLLNQY